MLSICIKYVAMNISKTFNQKTGSWKWQLLAADLWNNVVSFYNWPREDSWLVFHWNGTKFNACFRRNHQMFTFPLNKLGTKFNACFRRNHQMFTFPLNKHESYNEILHLHTHPVHPWSRRNGRNPGKTLLQHR